MLLTSPCAVVAYWTVRTARVPLDVRESENWGRSSCWLKGRSNSGEKRKEVRNKLHEVRDRLKGKTVGEDIGRLTRWSTLELEKKRFEFGATEKGGFKF